MQDHETIFLLFKNENLVFWARSEMIGSAIGQVSNRCQVSGFST